MKINCLSCGHNVDLSEAYDDYTGLIKCFACQALLEIQTQDGYLRSVQLANDAFAAPELPGLSDSRGQLAETSAPSSMS